MHFQYGRLDCLTADRRHGSEDDIVSSMCGSGSVEEALISATCSRTVHYFCKGDMKRCCRAGSIIRWPAFPGREKAAAC